MTPRRLLLIPVAAAVLASALCALLVEKPKPVTVPSEMYGKIRGGEIRWHGNDSGEYGRTVFYNNVFSELSNVPPLLDRHPFIWRRPGPLLELLYTIDRLEGQ